MFKCDRCHNKIADGELPACIEACPEDVQTIGPRDEIIAEAHRLQKEEGVYLYGEKENGGTNTIYISPVPFDELNKAIEKGPGRPHLNPVEDQMAVCRQFDQSGDDCSHRGPCGRDRSNLR